VFSPSARIEVVQDQVVNCQATYRYPQWIAAASLKRLKTL